MFAKDKALDHAGQTRYEILDGIYAYEHVPGPELGFLLQLS